MDGIKAAGIQVVGVSYDSVVVLKKFSDRKGIAFPLLSDPGSKVIDAYRLRNHQVKPGSMKDGIAHPGTILIDSKGTVRGTLPGTVRQRHSPAALLEEAGKLK